MLKEGTISKEDFNLIKITDNLEEIVDFTDEQIKIKLKEIEQEGLTDKITYSRLKKFIKERDNGC